MCLLVDGDDAGSARDLTDLGSAKIKNDRGERRAAGPDASAHCMGQPGDVKKAAKAWGAADASVSGAAQDCSGAN